MCGITVAIKLAGRSGYCSAKTAATNGTNCTNGLSANHLEPQLASSLDAIHHRGPDSHGTWISPDGNIGTSTTPNHPIEFLAEHHPRTWQL